MFFWPKWWSFWCPLHPDWDRWLDPNIIFFSEKNGPVRISCFCSCKAFLSFFHPVNCKSTWVFQVELPDSKKQKNNFLGLCWVRILEACWGIFWAEFPTKLIPLQPGCRLSHLPFCRGTEEWHLLNLESWWVLKPFGPWRGLNRGQYIPWDLNGIGIFSYLWLICMIPEELLTCFWDWHIQCFSRFFHPPNRWFSIATWHSQYLIKWLEMTGDDLLNWNHQEIHTVDKQETYRT